MVKPFYTIFGIALAVVFFLVGLWYWNTYGPLSEEVAFQRELDRAEEAHHIGKTEEALDSFLKAAEMAPSQYAEIQLKFQIAYELFARNSGDDRAQAARTLKGIINDSEISPFQRAIAVHELVTLSFVGDQQFNNEMFSGEPLGGFLKEAESLVYRRVQSYAIRRTYEMAEELFPLSMSEFQIAAWYAGALESGFIKDEAQRQEFLSELRKWTEKGEANLAFSLNLPYEASRKGELYQRNAVARYVLFRNGIGSFTQVEELFKKGLNAVAPAIQGGDVHAFGMGAYLRYHYAAAVAEQYGDGRKEDIGALLDPIINPPTGMERGLKDFSGFMYGVVNRGTHEHHRRDILLLAGLIPEFKSKLEAWGVNFE